MILISVDKGEEVIDTITRRAAELGITNAAICSLIGAVEGSTVSVMPAHDPLADTLTNYEQPFELTGTGEIVGGKVHIHVSLGGDGTNVVGHLHRATVQSWFVRAYVEPVTAGA
jgi:uncharacterized protein